MDVARTNVAVVDADVVLFSEEVVEDVVAANSDPNIRVAPFPLMWKVLFFYLYTWE